MPKKKYIVDLSDEEREQLLGLTRHGKTAARKLSRAHLLLKAAEGWKDKDIAAALRVGHATVERTRQRFVEEGLGALNERPRPGKKPLLDEKAEARLIAEACSSAPAGRECWTLQLLAERVVELSLVEACSRDTVRRVLKKTRSSLGKRSSGASLK